MKDRLPEMIRKFIIKAQFFVTPFFLVFLVNSVLYKTNEGDLVRVGYIYSNPTLEKKISKLYEDRSEEKKHIRLTELNNGLHGEFDIVTIGDSFSNFDKFGYQNYLAHQGLRVLDIDFYLLGQNPIQNLIDLTNGDFFDHIHTKYVVLQTVERFAIERSKEVDFTKKRSMDDVRNAINKRESYYIAPKPIGFFSNNNLHTPWVNIEYLFKERPQGSPVYKVVSEDRMFSVRSDRILFEKGDYSRLKQKNDQENVKMLIDTVNTLNELLGKKNIRLIFMIAPDKYDLYYPCFKNMHRYEESLFFDAYNGMEKGYIDIPAYSILAEEVRKGVKDIYFYDDTHWSPIAARHVADHLFRIVGTIYSGTQMGGNTI